MPRDPRVLVALQLTVNTIVGQLFLGFFQDWRVAATAVGTALAAEAALSWLTQRRLPSLISAYITGVSIGIIIDSPSLWIYAAASLLAIASKYLIHLEGRHIFNPSNFGVVAVLLLAPDLAAVGGSQWTNLIWIMLAIAALGSLVMSRVGRLDVVLAFFATFAAMAAVRTLAAGVPPGFAIGPLAGSALQLFAFFMITDPRTSPQTRRGRIVYGVVIGVLDGILRMLRVIYSPFYALFAVCLGAPLLAALARRTSPAVAEAGR